MKKLKQDLLSSGHNACSGCGQMIAARTVAKTLGPDVVIVNATGCLEVTTTPYPFSAWEMPWIHSLFENAPAIASGIRAAFDYKNKKNKGKEKIKKVVAQGGDGATFDIGFGLLSGLWERGEDILYICYDNEAYANTGIQASGATPWSAETTTTPVGIESIGSKQTKKDMLAIALAHKVSYVAQSSAGYPDDIAAKVKKAVSISGPSYLQILVPCVPGWKIKSSETIKAGKLAVQTGLYPLLEYENGKLLSKSIMSPKKINVEEYLKIQGRFKHLFAKNTGNELIKNIQAIADDNIKKYNLE